MSERCHCFTLLCFFTLVFPFKYSLTKKRKSQLSKNYWWQTMLSLLTRNCIRCVSAVRLVGVSTGRRTFVANPFKSVPSLDVIFTIGAWSERGELSQGKSTLMISYFTIGIWWSNGQKGKGEEGKTANAELKRRWLSIWAGRRGLCYYGIFVKLFLS